MVDSTQQQETVSLVARKLDTVCPGCKEQDEDKLEIHQGACFDTGGDLLHCLSCGDTWTEKEVEQFMKDEALRGLIKQWGGKVF